MQSAPTQASPQYPYADQLALLSSLFEGGSYTPQVLRAVLDAHSGNVERAAEYILTTPDVAFTSASLAASAAPSERPLADDTRVAAGAADGQVDADEMMAMHLQQMYVEEAERERWEAELAADADVNRQRYEQVRQREARERAAGAPTPVENDVDDERQEMSNEEQQRVIVENLKEIVIPAIRDQLAGTSFPDIQNRTDKMQYELSRIVLASFTLPNEAVEVKLEENHINVEVANIMLELEVGCWKYERTSVPKIKDSGSAKATLRQVNAVMKITNAEEGSARRRGNPVMRVTHCKVHVGDIKLKTGETKVAWIYNTLAVLMKPALKNATEAGLSEAIRGAIEDQINDWQQWADG